MPAVQLVIKPRDMPMRVTTAAMPTAMPKRVRPVRMGRRHKPRVTTLRKVMSGIGGEFRGVAVENNSAIFHLDGARRSPRHGHVVSDQDKSHLPLAVKIGQQIENEDCVFGIEISGRFVREKDGRRVRETPGDGDALAFAAGKFGRKMIYSRLEADGLQQFASASGAGRTR